MSHDNRLKENMQEAADSDSNIDVSVQSVTGVGTGKKKHHRPGERNKAI